MERPPAQLHPLQVTANTGAAVCFVPADILSEDRSTLVMCLWVQQCIVQTSVVGEMIFLRGEQLERRLVEPPAGLVYGMEGNFSTSHDRTRHGVEDGVEPAVVAHGATTVGYFLYEHVGLHIMPVGCIAPALLTERHLL